MTREDLADKLMFDADFIRGGAASSVVADRIRLAAELLRGPSDEEIEAGSALELSRHRHVDDRDRMNWEAGARWAREWDAKRDA